MRYRSLSSKSIVCDLHFGTLVLASYCFIVEIKENTNFFQNASFKEYDNMAVGKISL